MHPLFQKYPINGQQILSNGDSVTTPYHIYDGSILMIGGTADYEAIAALIRDEQVMPIRTEDNRAMFAVWVCDFKDANLGAHRELQFSVFVSSGQAASVKPHPFRILELVSSDPDVSMLCHGLWNTTERVVNYNRELLGLNAKFAESNFTADSDAIRFQFCEPSGAMIFEGECAAQHRQSPGAAFKMMSAFSFRDFMKVSSQPWLSMGIVNPISPRLPENRIAMAYTASSRRYVRRFDPQCDKLAFGYTPYRGVGFRADFVYQLDGCKFVYTMPGDVIAPEGFIAPAPRSADRALVQS